MAKRVGSQIVKLLKVGIHPIPLRAGGVQHIIGKLLIRTTTLFLTSSQLEVYTQKLRGPKVARIPTFVNAGLSLGSLGTKCHLDVGLMEMHKIYYKGEGGGSPKSGLW
jgi:hypothetical protein